MRTTTWQRRAIILAVLAACGCGDKKAEPSETSAKKTADSPTSPTAKGQTPKGLAAQDVLKVRAVKSVDDLKKLLAAWGDHAFYEDGTAFISLATPKFRKVYVTINQKTGVPEHEFRLQLTKDTTAEQVEALAKRLKLLHPVFRGVFKKDVKDAVSGKFEVSFGGPLPVATLRESSGWTLSVCGHQSRDPGAADLCWGALEQILRDRVLGVAADCYEDGKSCLKDRLADIEQIAGRIMSEIQVGKFNLADVLFKGAHVLSVRKKDGKAYLFISSTSKEDDGAIIKLFAKHLPTALKGAPAAKSLDGIILADWQSKETTVPL